MDTQPRQVGRRTLIAGAGGAALGATPDSQASEPQAALTDALHQDSSKAFARFSWLGTSGWEVRTSTTRILVDPYLTRFDAGLAAGKFDATTRLTVDRTAIDDALGPPGDGFGSVQAILVTHTHWDHFADVPHIAATRDAAVFTTLTGYYLGQAMGLASAQLATVKGGEELRIGDLVVRVVPSLHSRSASGGVLFPGLRITPPATPSTIADLPEGDTLSFLLRSPEGRSILLMGASDYDDRALRGLSPDVVALPVPSNDVTADYVGRLMSALDHPRMVVPVHWDNFESELANPPRALDAKTGRRLRTMIDEVRRHSPRTKVILPSYLQPLWLL